MSDISHHQAAGLVGQTTGFAEAPRAADYIELLKPRVMSLVVFTGWVGLLLAPGHLHPVLATVAVLCIAVGAGASGAINMWYDRDIDAVMARTAARPVPSGRVAAADALGFGVFLSAASVLVMGMAINWVAAFLLAFTIGFYVFVYTIWLKRRTPHNIVIGGAAGAFPPMIGWAAATGGVEPGSVALFALIFLWTPPHFWALALFRCRDYARAGVPMLPVVAGERATKVQMFIYTLVLLPAAVAPGLLGVAGPVYLTGAAVLGLTFVAAAWSVLRSPDGVYGPAKRMFGFSILYLFLLFALLAGERLLTGGL
jgi:heme o synthase